MPLETDPFDKIEKLVFLDPGHTFEDYQQFLEEKFFRPPRPLNSYEVEVLKVSIERWADPKIKRDKRIYENSAEEEVDERADPFKREQRLQRQAEMRARSEKEAADTPNQPTPDVASSTTTPTSVVSGNLSNVTDTTRPTVVTDTRMKAGPEKRGREEIREAIKEAKSQNIGEDVTPSEGPPAAVLPQGTPTTTTNTTTNPVGAQPMPPTENPNHWWGPVRRRTNREGAWTGATRPTYPKVFRPFGNNTRERVVGHRTYTGMNHLGYAKEIVESRPSPPFLPPTATLGQSGAPSVLQDVPALRRGNHHWLFHGNGAP
jgi:hypothetical protein